MVHTVCSHLILKSLSLSLNSMFVIVLSREYFLAQRHRIADIALYCGLASVMSVPSA